MDHPSIVETMRTGYPRPQPKPYIGDVTISCEITINLTIDDDICEPVRDWARRKIEMECAHNGWACHVEEVETDE